jgi:hypothetical protein
MDRTTILFRRQSLKLPEGNRPEPIKSNITASECDFW